MLSLNVNSLMGEGIMGHTSVREPLLWYNYFMGYITLFVILKIGTYKSWVKHTWARQTYLWRPKSIQQG